MPVGLYQQRHGDQRDDQRAAKDDLALEAEQQHHRDEKPEDRERLHAGFERLHRRLTTSADKAPARHIPY